MYIIQCMSGVSRNLRTWTLRHSGRPLAERGPDPAGARPPRQKQQWRRLRRRPRGPLAPGHCCFCLGDGRRPGLAPVCPTIYRNA